MCYNYEISRDTFLIGTALTAINAYIFRDSYFFSVLNIGWIPPILMQLYEAMIWKDYHCELATKLALITNIAQPLCVLLLLGGSGKFIAKDPNYLVIAMTCIVYALSVVSYLGRDYGCIRDEDGIGLVWWDLPTAVVYCVTMTILAFQLATPKAALVILSYFYLTVFAAWVLTFKESQLRKETIEDRDAGRVGSIWCWAASFAPIYNLLIFKFLGM